MVVFARLVRAGSFTAAAARLAMPKSPVSRKVSDLEERLSARLLQRATRKLSLTDIGRTYYDYCARILSEAEDAERAVTSLQDTPRGSLRVTAPANAAFLGPLLSDYVKRYPEVRLELFCSGRLVDLVEEPSMSASGPARWQTPRWWRGLSDTPAGSSRRRLPM